LEEKTQEPTDLPVGIENPGTNGFTRWKTKKYYDKTAIPAYVGPFYDPA
jgi:hypothetical protein